MNELIKETGFVISPYDIVLFDFNFLSAQVGIPDNLSGTNGYFEFRISPAIVNNSAYSEGVITATAFDPTANDRITVGVRHALPLQAWTQNGTLNVSGQKPVVGKKYTLITIFFYYVKRKAYLCAEILKRKKMEATVFNPTQLHLLKMFSYNKDEDSLKELKDVLFEYYCQKASEEGKRIWKEKNLSNETMQEWLNTHIRTPYK
jgi:hypothetical protein